MRSSLLAPAMLAMLANLPAACTDTEEITVDEVITKLEARPTGARLAADGATPVEVEVCTIDEGRAPDVDAELVTSDGAWQLPDGASAKVSSVPMSAPCEKRLLTPPATATRISVAATIKDLTKTIPIDLVPACVERVRLKVQGTLSSTEASMLTVTAMLDVQGNGGGRATMGTLVTFADDVVPASAKRHFTERELLVGDAGSVQATLHVGPGATKVTLTVAVKPAGCSEATSEPFVFLP